MLILRVNALFFVGYYIYAFRCYIYNKSSLYKRKGPENPFMCFRPFICLIVILFL